VAIATMGSWRRANIRRGRLLLIVARAVPEQMARGEC
jgi:hypothetical protein